MKTRTKNSKLPSFLKPLFWSYKFSSVDPEENVKTVIVNTVNYGDWKQWKWLVKYYGAKRLKSLIENIPASEFRKDALRLISLLLNIKKMKHVSRSDKIRAEKNIR